MKKRLNLERLYLLVSLVYHNFDLDLVAAKHSTNRMAVIRHLKILEDELGTPLFHRTRKQTVTTALGLRRAEPLIVRHDRLTPAARRLVSACTPFFCTLDDLEHKAIRDNALSDLTTYTSTCPA